MDGNRTRASARVKAVAEALTKMEQLPFRDVLSAADVEAALLEHGVDFRDRGYPPDTTLFAFLAQRLNSDHSLKGAVSKVNAERVAAGKEEVHPNTGDYSKSRQRLPVEVVMTLATQAAQKMEAEIPDAWKWKGFHPKLMDGSGILMADTEENQEAYPQHVSQKKGVGFPIARLVALISLATGAVFDAAMGPFKGKGTGELTLARQLLRSLVSGDVLVVDRYYCSYFFIAMLLQAGVHIVTRSHGARQTDFRSGKRNGKGDHTVSLKKPQRPSWMDQETYDAMPDAIILREVKTKLAAPGYRAEDLVVVTTLVDTRRFKVDELSLLYDRRWHVELDLRAIKTVLDMEMINCKTPAMVEKELWVGFLAYNLIRKIMAQSAAVAKTDPRALSFNGALQAFMAFSKLWSTNDTATNERLYLAMITQISKERVGNRPGRREPRAVKRRPKPFPRLTIRREWARARLM